MSSVPVPYNGSALLVADFLGGQVMAGIAGVADFLPYHQAGRLKIVAATRATPLLPGVPSFAEAGIAGLQVTDILGLFAPAAVPESVVLRYNAALNRVLAQPDIQERYRGQIMTTVPGSPEQQLQNLVQANQELAALVRESGFVPQ